MDISNGEGARICSFPAVHLFLIYYQKVENRHVDMRLPTCLWGHRCLSGGHGNSPAPPAVWRWDPPLCHQWRWASGSPEIHSGDLHIQGQSCCQDSLNEHGDTQEKINSYEKISYGISHMQKLLPPPVCRHLKIRLPTPFGKVTLPMDRVVESWQEQNLLVLVTCKNNN